MRISIQCDTNICMPHNILQRFWIHSRLCHVGTKGMPTHMRSYLWHLHFIDAVVLLAYPLHSLLPIICRGRISILIQKDKSRISINHFLDCRLFPVQKNFPKAFIKSSMSIRISPVGCGNTSIPYCFTAFITSWIVSSLK